MWQESQHVRSDSGVICESDAHCESFRSQAEFEELKGWEIITTTFMLINPAGGLLI